MKRGTDTSKKFAPHSEGEHRIKSSHGNSMHVCVCTCAYVCRYVCMWQHVHTGEGMHTRMRICVMVCTHVCTRARSCVYLMCVHACVPPSLTPLRALRPDQTAFSLCGEHPVFGSNASKLNFIASTTYQRGTLSKPVTFPELTFFLIRTVRTMIFTVRCF